MASVPPPPIQTPITDDKPARVGRVWTSWFRDMHKYLVSVVVDSVAAHLADTSGAHTASAISNSPTGNLAATDVQGALNELQTDVDGRASASHPHSAADITSGTLAVARGGTGQTTAAAAFDALSPSTTKGDLTARSSSSNVRLGVGSDGQVLTADSAQTLGVKWAASASAPDSSEEISNLTLVASVAANALTIALKNKAGSDPSGGDPVKIGFRNATAATGTYSQVSATAATSVVVSSGSTLGHASAVNQYVYVYAINNAGTIELAVTNAPIVDQGAVITTTAEGGAGTADTAYTLYSTTARTGVAARLIGRVKSNQATAGTWASAPSEISLIPFASSGSQAVRSEVLLSAGNGYGSSSTKIRRFSNTLKNVGSAITYADSATLGATFTINEDGVYAVSYSDIGPASLWALGISRNSSQLTTNVTSINDADIVAVADGASSGRMRVSETLNLSAGDVIRPHGEAASSNTSSSVRFRIAKVAN